MDRYRTGVRVVDARDHVKTADIRPAQRIGMLMCVNVGGQSAMILWNDGEREDECVMGNFDLVDD